MREYSCSRKSARSCFDGRVGLNRDDVGARRHHLAHQRAAEVDDRLQQFLLVALDQRLLLGRLLLGARFRHLFAADGRGAVLALAARVVDQPDERARQRVQEPRGEVERRQQQRQHLLGVAADDQQRQHVLEEQDEHRHEQQQHPDRREALRAGQHRKDDGRQREDQAEHQTGGDEELDRIVEVDAQAIVAAAALDGEAEREPHQRTERRLDGADVDRGEREHQQQRNHERSINPAGRPPRRRSRASARAILPRSPRWSWS